MVSIQERGNKKTVGFGESASEKDLKLKGFDIQETNVEALGSRAYALEKVDGGDGRFGSLAASSGGHARENFSHAMRAVGGVVGGRLLYGVLWVTRAALIGGFAIGGAMLTGFFPPLGFVVGLVVGWLLNGYVQEKVGQLID